MKYGLKGNNGCSGGENILNNGTEGRIWGGGTWK